MADRFEPLAPDWYAELDVTPEATRAEIDASYRRLARSLHPDSASPDSVDVERLGRVFEAHSLLSNPKRRREYDASRDAHARDESSRQARPCPVCNGARVIITTCGACDGSGMQASRRLWITNALPCLVCLGTRRWSVECGACAGTGRTTVRPLR